MNLWLRFLYVLISGCFRKRLHILEQSVLSFCVLPNDLDPYGHMNNGRYLTLMDLGRIDLIYRTPLGKLTHTRYWKPLVASSHIRYKKSLRLGDSYQLKTRIIFWDDKWFFIEQSFENEGQLFAKALVKGLFIDKQHHKVPSSELMKGLSINEQNIQNLDPIKKFLDLDDVLC